MFASILLFAVGATPALEVEARVPRQRVGDSFATATVGGSIEGFNGSSGGWDHPAGSGAFERASPPFTGQASLRIGALHFFGHADIHLDIPLSLFRGSSDDRLGATVSHTTITGIDFYPWALAPGTLRPFVSTGLMVQDLVLEGPLESGRVRQFVFPIGVGVGWRSPLGLMLDAQLQRVFGGHGVVSSGAPAQPYGQDPPDMAERAVSSEGWRTLVGVRWSFDTNSAIVRSGWREEEVGRLQARVDDGTASGLTLAIGPSSRIVRNGGRYFDEMRPYLGRIYTDDAVFAHGGIGYYSFPWDSELRLAFRAFGGGASASGASLHTSQKVGFLEVLKFFEVDLYGFVPFVGAGVGYGQLSFRDEAGSERTEAEAWKALVSIPVGWDIRISPSHSWLLRTSLRWIPRAPLDLPGGSRFDFGGLEFDFIQLVVFPERWMNPV